MSRQKHEKNLGKSFQKLSQERELTYGLNFLSSLGCQDIASLNRSAEV